LIGCIETEMIIVTLATHDAGYFSVLKKSCASNGHQLQVLGSGEPFRGFQWRLNLIREYLQTLPATEIVICVDAYDVFVVANETTIVQRFNSFHSPIVMSVQHIPKRLEKYIFRKMFGTACRGLNLCAGMYMGYAHALLDLLQYQCTEFDCTNLKLDDQRMLMSLCKIPNGYFEQHVSLDAEGLIFLNLNTTIKPWSKEIELKHSHSLITIRNAKVIVKQTDLPPCFIHGPGDVNLKPIIELYGYSTELVISKSNDYCIRMIKEHWSLFLIEFILVVSVVMIFLIAAFIRLQRKHQRRV
jgi:hypothetical protein